MLANSRGFFSNSGAVDAPRVKALERALDGIGTADSTVRARLLANLADELVWSDQHERRQGLAAEALALARRSGDPVTLAYVLARRYPTLVPSAERRAKMAELEQLAEGPESPATRKPSPSVRPPAWSPPSRSITPPCGGSTTTRGRTDRSVGRPPTVPAVVDAHTSDQPTTPAPPTTKDELRSHVAAGPAPPAGGPSAGSGLPLGTVIVGARSAVGGAVSVGLYRRRRSSAA